MSRNKKYLLEWENSAGWGVALTIIPAHDATDDANAMANAPIVLIPDDVMLRGAFSTLKASFENEGPFGIVDFATLTLSVIISELDLAHERGWDDPDDLVDLATYLLHPRYENGGRFGRLLSQTGRSYDTYNYLRLEFFGGTFKERFTAFEGVQEEMNEDELVLNEAGVATLSVRVRHLWRVGLETITGADLDTSFFNPVNPVPVEQSQRAAFHTLDYPGGAAPYGDDWYFRGEFYRSPLRPKKVDNAERYLWTDYHSVQQKWDRIQALLENFYQDHVRMPITTYVSSRDNLSAGSPFDYVTLYKQTYDGTGTKGEAIEAEHDGQTFPNYDNVLFPSRARFRKTGDPDDLFYEPVGGFLSARAEFGLQKMKSLYDYTKMCTEQSLVKCVPMTIRADPSLVFFEAFSSWHTATTARSEGAFTLTKDEIQGEPLDEGGFSATRPVTLRAGVIGEAESGMNEGNGDDEKTMDSRTAGHEQREGMDVSIAMHNLPKLGVKDKDHYGVPTRKKLDHHPLFTESPPWESCLYYVESDSVEGFFVSGAEDPFTYWNAPGIIRTHENVSINLGNGHIETDTTTIPRLPSDSDELNRLAESSLAPRTGGSVDEWVGWKEVQREIMRRIQKETGWPKWATHCYTKYFSSSLQSRFTATIIPGEKVLPQYLGDWYELIDDAGVSKGLKIWWDSPRLDAFPKKYCLIETEIQFATDGIAIATFWGSPYAD